MSLRRTAMMVALLGAVAGPLGPSMLEQPKRSRSRAFTAERKAAAEAKRERKRQRRLKRGY